jgi:arylsulfatase A-like enzyme
MTNSPNLIFVCADQLRRMSCGFAGDKRAHTPNLDRFASTSVDFRQAVSCYPVCAAFRASFLTGKYPSSTGMVINELRMGTDHETIAHVLNRAGYEIDYIGKWHLWACDTKHSDMRNQFVPPGPNRLGFDGYWAGYNFNHQYNKAYYFENSPERIDVDGYEPDVQTDLAIGRIERHIGKEKPYSLFLNYGTPHDPWAIDNVPHEFAAMFDETDFPLPANYADGSAEYWMPSMNREWWMQNIKPNLPSMQRLYYAMTANLDWNFGRLLTAIEKSGQADNTIIVFTSDHGEMFGAHGRVAKITFYEEAASVPLLIRCPGSVNGRVSDTCINTPDLMPTLLGLVGLAIPEAVEGIDLSHCVLGKPGPEPEAALMQGMGHTFMWVDGFEWRALRDQRYTYAVNRADRQECLFDRVHDPLQMKNLAHDPEQAHRMARFRDMLKQRMAELGDTFEACTWYRDHWTDDRVILPSALRKS